MEELLKIQIHLIFVTLAGQFKVTIRVFSSRMWNKELPVVTAALRLTSRRQHQAQYQLFTAAKISYRRVKVDTSVPKLAFHREREIIKF